MGIPLCPCCTQPLGFVGEDNYAEFLCSSCYHTYFVSEQGITAKDYEDFEMYVDWKILAHGDSGIYLRGSPQVQIWDPAQWPVGSGGLYNNQKNPKDPSECADNPIGQWNRFFIRMVGEKVTVVLNGVKVVDNVTLENYWNRASPIFPSGQIELQNHGNTLWFKNIYIREIKAGEK